MSSFVVISLFIGGFACSEFVEIGVVFDSTALRNVSSNGFSCNSSNNPTSSHCLNKRVGVGVWS